VLTGLKEPLTQLGEESLNSGVKTARHRDATAYWVQWALLELHEPASQNGDADKILRELTINPDRDSPPRGNRPGPRSGHSKGGMPKGYKFPKKDK